MAVITLTLTQSEIQLLSGIPKFVELTTNIPTTIFYTLDGSDPDTSSSIYLGGELSLPTNQTTVILKVFATDGTDSSPIITNTFRPILTLRQSHDQITNNDPLNGLTPIYNNFGPNNLIVDKPDTANLFDGYDGTGTGTWSGGTDLPLENYLIQYSEANVIGERGRGIGTVPTNVVIKSREVTPTSSNVNDKFFNSRALVIYQDGRDEPFDPNVSYINRQFFSLENAETIKDGILFGTTAFEGLTTTGSFVRAHYNPRENTTTYYYFDSQTLRWIISKEAATVTPTSNGLSNIIFSSRHRSDRQVFRWHQFKRSRLI